RWIGLLAGFVALAALPALGLGAIAAAETSSDASESVPSTPVRARLELSDAQKQCLADHGVSKPAPSSTGERPQLTPEQRDALRSALQACGVEFPRLRPQLSDAQKQCLADHGVSKPAPSSTGERPQLTPEQRDALRSAFQACGIEFHRFGGGAQPQTAVA